MNQRLILLVTVLFGSVAMADQTRIICYDDDEGQRVCGDNYAPEEAPKKKKEYNTQGVPIGVIAGAKTEEELRAEAEAEEAARAIELQQRRDRALLATYQTVEEILMHRDRRVEIWQSQSRVTELYLRNLERRRESLVQKARGFAPYSDEQDAPMIDEDLHQDILETEGTIERHKVNLLKFEEGEKEIRARFQGDIDRFKALKGIE